jgi:aminopeptidase YwaD
MADVMRRGADFAVGSGARVLLGVVLLTGVLGPSGDLGGPAGRGLAAESAPASTIAPSAAVSSRMGGAPAQPPNADELAQHVAALTAPEMEGRASGTDGGARAARYLADRLAAMGLRPGGDGGTFLQSFTVGSVTGVAAGTALEPLAPPSAPLVVGRDWLPHGGSLEGDVTAAVVWVARGAAASGRGGDGYAGADVKGKIVLVLDGGERDASRLERLIAARRHGAVAVLIAGDSLPALAATETAVKLVSASVTRQAIDGLLAPAGTSAARLATAPSGDIRGLSLRIRVRLDRQPRTTANVIGLLPGTDPALASEALVLGAHYDHLGRSGGAVHHGADDNASGTSVVLGLARALAAGGGLPRTVVVALFSGEEIGLLGSAHYVQRPAVPIDRTAAMLNFDMVGRMRQGRLHVGGVESAAPLRALVAEAARGDRLDVALRDSPYAPSDHSSFYAAGVPVLFFNTGIHDDYHTPGDTADKLNVPGMADTARVALRIAERLGGGARPSYVKVAPPAAGARQGHETGARGGGAFLGVSVDVRSESDGIRLGSVIPGGAAERAGLRAGDVIVRIGDETIARFEDLRRALDSRRPDDRVTLVYLRGGEDATAPVVLGSRP